MDTRRFCSATRKDGSPCTLAALADAHECFAHDARRIESRRRGGQHSRQALHALDGQPLPASLRPILRQLGGIFRKVEAGTIKPDQARACAQVATAMARLVTVGTLEERMSQLEARMAAPTGGGPGAHTA